MLLAALGIGLFGLGVLYLAFKLYVSFETEAGAIGMVPVMDTALFCPPLIVGGLALIDHGLGWFVASLWVYGVGWIVLAILIGWLIGLVGRWGEAVHQSAENRRSKEPRS